MNAFEIKVKVHWRWYRMLNLGVFYERNRKLMKIFNKYKLEHKTQLTVDKVKWSQKTHDAVYAQFKKSWKDWSDTYIKNKWSWDTLGYGPVIDNSVKYGYIYINTEGNK